MSINTQPPRPRSSSPRLKRKRNFRRDVGDISAFARGSSAITPTDDPSAGDHATRPKPFSSKEDGGARRDRTDDLMLAKHALSQLSYGPSFGERKMRAIRRGARRACGLRPVASSARGDARHDARHQARRPSGLRPSAGRFLSKRRCAPSGAAPVGLAAFGRSLPQQEEMRAIGSPLPTRSGHRRERREPDRALGPREPSARRRLRHKMVGLGRLELPTSRLSSARSNQLSYKPKPRAYPARSIPSPVIGGPTTAGDNQTETKEREKARP